jgi:NAD+ synthase
LDSSVVAKLVTNALGKNRVIGVLLPEKDFTEVSDLEDARHLSSDLGIITKEYNISPLVDAFIKQESELIELKLGGAYRHRNAYGNLKARIRMIKLYIVSQMLPGRSLVIGTTDKSEWLMGYFTKYGDGGADLEPIISLYKTQVRGIAREIGLPANIISKKSSPNLIPGVTAEKELGFSYEELDLILTYLIDGGYMITNLQAGKDLLFERYGIDSINVDKVIEKINETTHKRQLPASANVRHIQPFVL